MKCPICGADAPFNSNFCPSCGYEYSKNNDSVSSANSANNNGYSYNRFANQNYGYQNNSYNFPMSTYKQKIGNRTGVIVAVLLIVVAVAVGIYFYGKNATKTYSFKGFSITLPNDLEKVNNSKFASAIMTVKGFNGMEAEEYVGKQIRFAYCVTGDYSKMITDESQKAQLDSVLNTDYLINGLQTNYQKQSGYKEIAKDSDSLKFIMPDSNGRKTYNHVKVYIKNYKMYVFFILCNDYNQSKYEKKFEEWLDSFEIK